MQLIAFFVNIFNYLRTVKLLMTQADPWIPNFDWSQFLKREELPWTLWKKQTNKIND